MIRNLTPHVVDLVTAVGTVQLPPESAPARLRQQTTTAGWLDVSDAAVELFDVRVGCVENLPESQPGVWLVVPRVVADACPARRDLVFPFREVRDDTGRVVGCQALGRAVGPGV